MKAPFQAWGVHPEAGVWEQPINKLTFTLARRPETPGCSQVSGQGYAVLPSDQRENDGNANLLELQSPTAPKAT